MPFNLTLNPLKVKNNDEIYTLDEISEYINKPFPNLLPTILSNITRKKVLTQDEFNKTYKRAFVLSNILQISTPDFVTPVYYIYGINDITEFNNKIAEICELYKGDDKFITKGCLYIYSYNVVKIRMKMYSSISEILHSIPVSDRQMGYDGEITYFTNRGAHSYIFNYNVFDNSKINDTYIYCNDLYESLKKGVNIIFPNLKVSGEIINIFPFSLKVKNEKSLILSKFEYQENEISFMEISFFPCSQNGREYHNIKEILNNKNRFFKKIDNDINLTLKISKSCYIKFLEKIKKKLFDNDRYDYKSVKDIFHLNDKETCELLLMYFNKQNEEIDTYLNEKINTLLIDFKEITIDDWFKEDEFISIDPKNYYPNYYREINESDYDKLYQDFYDEIDNNPNFCIFCQNIIIKTDSIIKLDCDHVFHLKTTQCPGFVRYLRKGNNICPICRKVIDEDDELEERPFHIGSESSSVGSYSNIDE